MATPDTTDWQPGMEAKATESIRGWPPTELEITYHNFESESNRAHIDKIIKQYSWLFPSWLRELKVGIYDTHDDHPEDTIAWSTGRPEYGSSTINVMSSWLDRPLQLQHSLVLHEILHIAHRREYNFVWDRLLNPLQNRNEELHTVLVEDFRERNEEFIEGLTRAILAQNKEW